MNMMTQPSRMKSNVTELADRDPSVAFSDTVLKAIGKKLLDGIQVLGSSVFVATYVRPRKTAGGIIIPDQSVHEDRYQGKAGLVLKMGAMAFKYDGQFPYEGPKPEVGSYVMFETASGRELFLNSVSCKFVPDQLIRMIIPNPDLVY